MSIPIHEIAYGVPNTVYIPQGSLTRLTVLVNGENHTVYLLEGGRHWITNTDIPHRYFHTDPWEWERLASLYIDSDSDYDKS